MGFDEEQARQERSQGGRREDKDQGLRPELQDRRSEFIIKNT